jgi:hypothetical protein
MAQLGRGQLWFNTMSQGCGKLDNNGKVVSGSKLPCGTKLSYGVGKGASKHTEVHLCEKCQALLSS